MPIADGCVQYGRRLVRAGVSVTGKTYVSSPMALIRESKEAVGGYITIVKAESLEKRPPSPRATCLLNTASLLKSADSDEYRYLRGFATSRNLGCTA